MRFGKEYIYVSAAGAYQITEGTADSFKEKAGVKDFSPKSQDALAVAIIKGRKALDAVKSGDLGSAFKKLNREWSSLPGGSQENKNVDAEKTFRENISLELNRNSSLATEQGKLKI